VLFQNEYNQYYGNQSPSPHQTSTRGRRTQRAPRATLQ